MEFLRVAGTRRKWVTNGLILQVRPHRPGEKHTGEDRPIRVGFTVSRKVGNAVARNRARRRLRAVVEEILPRCAQEGHDYVVIGRAATVGRSFEALKKDLKWALRKLGLYRQGEETA